MYSEFILAFAGFLLSVITALIGYMAKSLGEIKAFSFKKIASLEVDLKNTNRILTQIIVDLKVVEAHGRELAVMQSKLGDLRVSIRQVFKRVHEIEIGDKGRKR